MDEAWKLFQQWVTLHGGRHTPERRQMFDIVYTLPQLFTAIDLQEACAKRAEQGLLRLSRPTVYNTLDSFVLAGVLECVHTCNGTVYVRTDAKAGMVITECTGCGTLTVVKPGGVAQAVSHLAYKRFTPNRSVTLVRGTCSRCEAALKKELKQKNNTTL